jgi:hypothetical protein
MVAPPKNRVELVLMSDHPAPIHLWVKSTAELARRFEFNKEKSIRFLSALAVSLVLMILFFRGATLILLLIALMVLLPLWLVELTGFFRGT